MGNCARKILTMLTGSAFLLAFPQPAAGQPALGGTDWEANTDCIFDFLHFYADGTSKMIHFNSNEGDPNLGNEIKLPGTWVFDGARLSVKFNDFPNDSLVGSFEGSDLKVTYTWMDSHNAAHDDQCTLTQDTSS